MRKQASLAATTEQKKGTVAGLVSASPVDGASSVLALTNSLALDPRADVEKLDPIIAMYERLKAKEAELQYNAAKGRILKKLAAINIVKKKPALYEIEEGRPQNGTHEAFKYAPLEEIDNHLRPLLAEEEMDLLFRYLGSIFKVLGDVIISFPQIFPQTGLAGRPASDLAADN